MSIVNRTFLSLILLTLITGLIHAQSVKEKGSSTVTLEKGRRFVLSQEDHMIENFTLKQSIMPRLHPGIVM